MITKNFSTFEKISIIKNELNQIISNIEKKTHNVTLFKTATFLY